LVEVVEVVGMEVDLEVAVGAEVVTVAIKSI
jgi:hypothetical protein